MLLYCTNNIICVLININLRRGNYYNCGRDSWIKENMEFCSKHFNWIHLFVCFHKMFISTKSLWPIKSLFHKGWYKFTYQVFLNFKNQYFKQPTRDFHSQFKKKKSLLWITITLMFATPWFRIFQTGSFTIWKWHPYEIIDFCLQLS